MVTNLNFIFRLSVVVIVAASVLVFAPKKGQADLNLGLTPSHVFGIWVNINEALMTLQFELNSDSQITSEFRNLKPTVYSKKKPNEVLELISQFSGVMDKLAVRGRRAKNNEVFADEILFLLKEDDDVVTPSLVYLRSGQVLIDIVSLISISAEIQKPISRYFVSQNFKAKTPSDVFGMVELAHRRIEEIASLYRLKAPALGSRP